MMIQRHMINTGADYDYIVRSRPETAFFESVVPLSRLIDNNHTIKHVSHDLGASSGYAAVTNYLTMAHRNVMRPYLDRFLAIQTIGNETTWSYDRKGDWWAEESFSVNYMREFFEVEHEDMDLAASMVRDCTIKTGKHGKTNDKSDDPQCWANT